MSLENIDKAVLKAMIKEIIAEDINLFKGIIKEILTDYQVIVSDEQALRRKRLKQLIDEDFDKYNDVFKALA